MVAVQALPADPGPAAWAEILPKGAQYPALEGQQQADYLVVGCGFAGLSAARRLVQLLPEARVSLLEARRVASGPAGRNSGFMIDLPHDLSSDDYAGAMEDDQRHTRMNRAAIQFAQQAAQEYGMPAEALVASGKVNAAATDKGLKHNLDYAEHLKGMNEPFKLLGAKAMRDLTGIDYYQGGLWTPGTAMLQPALYIRELAAGLAAHNNLRLFEQSPVIRLQKTGDHWEAQTPQGTIKAQTVILAVNGLLQHFGFYQRRFMHVFTYASMTRALNTAECRQLGGQPQWGCTPADPMGSTVRRISGLGGDRIVIRNRFTYDPDIRVSANRIRRVAQDHDQAFAARFPELAQAGVEMEYRWGGRLCLSLNNVSALGELDNGLFSACCQNGLGTAKGTCSGILAAEQAVGLEVHSSLLPDYEPEAEPKRLWPEPMMFLGANTYLRWKEWCAGKEL